MMYIAILMYCSIHKNSLNEPTELLEYLTILPRMDTMNQETIIEYVLFFDEFKLLNSSSLSYSEKCLLLNEKFNEMKSNSYDTDETDDTDDTDETDEDETSYETLSTQDVSDDETSYETLSTQSLSDDDSN